jgi:hypothetical protein
VFLKGNFGRSGKGCGCGEERREREHLACCYKDGGKNSEGIGLAVVL